MFPMGPLAQSVVDIVRLIGKAIVGGEKSSAGGGVKLSRAERKGQGAAETLRAQRELNAGLSVISAVALLIGAAFVFQIRGGGGPAPQPIEVLVASDASALRAALFGVAPAVVECSSPRASGPSLLQEAAAERLLPDGLRTLTTECDRPMTQGGPSLLERFSITAPATIASPLLLQAGRELSAPMAVGRHSSARSLVRHLTRWSREVHLPQLNSTLDLRRHCLSRPVCFVLMASGTPAASARKALLKAASVGASQGAPGVAVLNRKSHTASFSAQIPQTPRAVLIALRNTAATNGPLTAEARAFQGLVHADQQLELDAFVSSCAKGSGFKKLDMLPRITLMESATSGGVDVRNEELYDPLLSSKRYERETSLS